MPVYYHGPMPKTDDERAIMRAEALSEPQNMRDSCEPGVKVAKS
jgi:hypothetical protein